MFIHLKNLVLRRRCLFAFKVAGFQACPLIKFVKLFQTLLLLISKARQHITRSARFRRFSLIDRTSVPPIICGVRSNTWIFTEDMGLRHIDTVECSGPKEVGFIVRQPDCRAAYLQVKTWDCILVLNSDGWAICHGGGWQHQDGN